MPPTTAAALGCAAYRGADTLLLLRVPAGAGGCINCFGISNSARCIAGEEAAWEADGVRMGWCGSVPSACALVDLDQSGRGADVPRSARAGVALVIVAASCSLEL